ncbi:MAG TPA: hypothetical protein VG826_18310 [Pirellulales bacterium]|nr:hypothetical protein [Pirellulales bacterium]
MPAGIAEPALPLAEQPTVATDRFGGRDRLIETHIRRTRRNIKLVDVASSLTTLVAVSLAYLMAAALVDQQGAGLGSLGRIAAFVGLVAGLAALSALLLVRLSLRRVSSVYAAWTLERSQSQAKNSLINFLFLRSGNTRLPASVYEEVKTEAVNSLVVARGEAAIDRGPIIRGLLVLAAIVAFIAVYLVASPKSLFASFQRIIVPWADIAAPTRVAIVDVHPGDAHACHEQRLTVSAEVRSLRPNEPVLLVYSTLDNRIVRRSTQMTESDDGYRYLARLPSDEIGLQQDLEYWIEAGDAISPRWRVHVQAAPAITVEEVTYTYPDYSDIPPRVERGQGDLQALDGTRVLLRARATQPIRSAAMDFQCDRHDDLAMKVEGCLATVEFPLQLDPKTRRAQHPSYQLRFHNLEGEGNTKPIEYSVEVTDDLPPEIEFVEPRVGLREQLVTPADRPMRFAVRAVDRDFKLAEVRFHARRDGLPLVDEPLLSEARRGKFEGGYSFDPARWKLSPGEQIEVWASARDNRAPEANQAETAHLRLRVASSDAEIGPRQTRDPKLGSTEDNDPSAADAPADPDRRAGSGEQPRTNAATAEERDRRQADDGQPQNQTESAGRRSRGDQPGRLDPERDADRAMTEIRQFFEEESLKGPGDQQRRSPQGPGDEHASSRPTDPTGPNRPPQPSTTDKMGEGGPQAQNAEQGTAGKKEDGVEATFRQSSGNQGADNSAGAPQADNVGSRSSGGTQKERSKPDTPRQPGKVQEQPQAKFQPGMKRHDGGQSGETEKPRQSGVDDRPGNKVEPHRGDHPMPDDLARPSTSDASGERHQGENSHRRGGMSGAESSRHQPQKQMPDGVSGKGERRPRNDAAAEKPQERKAKLGDDMPKNADGLKPPKPGQGEDVFGSGDPNEKENASSKENFDDYKGGDPFTNDKGDAGAGEQGTNHEGSPPPGAAQRPEDLVHISQVRDKKQISLDGEKPKHEDEPDAPAKEGAIKQSDSKSNMKGDRQGGGKSGGGQRAENQGTGAAGQNTASNQGGGQSDQQGGGPTGTKGGDRTKANQPTGGKPSGEQGSGSHRQAGKTRLGGTDNSPSPPAADPSGHSNDAPQQIRQQNPAEPQSPEGTPKHPPKAQPAGPQTAPRENHTSPTAGGDPNQIAQPGAQPGGAGADPAGRGRPGPAAPPPRGPVDDEEPGGEEANPLYAQRVTDFAIERLRDQLASDDLSPDLLDRLRWTRDDVERFLAQWERLGHADQEPAARGDSARRELDDAFAGVALPPAGASQAAGARPRDEKGNARRGRRTSPPPEYAEHWFEFNRSLNADRAARSEAER